MKVLFLDLDGVVNTFSPVSGFNSTYWKTNDYFDKELVENLNRVFDEVEDLKFVMSSSWRNDMEDAFLMLKKVGFRHEDRCIGKTPNYNRRVMYSSSVNYRGLEILEYLETLKSEHTTVKWMAVDDYEVGLTVGLNEKALIPSEKLCKTNSADGLTKEKADCLINYFKEGDTNEYKES